MKSELLTIAFRRIRSRFRRCADSGDEDSEDALQEAFCRLWGRRADVNDVSHAEGLLVKTTRNIRIDSLRERTSHPSVSLSEFTDPPWISGNDDIADTYNRVTKIAEKHLSERDREILYKREQDGMSFSEIADEYDLSEANVRMIVSRARKTLRNLYRIHTTNM